MKKHLSVIIMVLTMTFGTILGTLLPSVVASASTTYSVRVDEGFLALRTAMAYDDSNIIGELYTGDTFEVTDTSNDTYWYGYSPKHGKSGYVNKNYLTNGGQTSQQTGSTMISVGEISCTVKVDSGYLAIRTAKAYDDSNIIGELYTGDTFIVTGVDDATYCYGYSPVSGIKGYVNSNYLYVNGGNYQTSQASGSRTVCPICNGTGQQYIPNLYYDCYQGWYGGYIGCGGCGCSGYIG